MRSSPRARALRREGLPNAFSGPWLGGSALAASPRGHGFAKRGSESSQPLRRGAPRPVDPLLPIVHPRERYEVEQGQPEALRQAVQGSDRGDDHQPSLDVAEVALRTQGALSVTLAGA
jgi:hypothetical protein